MEHGVYPQHVATNPRGVGELTLTIAAEVRLQRDARKLKQEELSALAKIPRPTLSRIENGQAAIDVEQIERIAHAFGMLPEEFVASARRNAEARREAAAREQKEAVYLPDGAMNSAVASTSEPSDEEVREIEKQRKTRSS